jgi:hypothetical protein
MYNGRQGKIQKQASKCKRYKSRQVNAQKRQARKDTKAGKERYKCRQLKVQKQVRTGTKAGKERYKGRP